jgi:hypothetical protein
MRFMSSTIAIWCSRRSGRSGLGHGAPREILACVGSGRGITWVLWSRRHHATGFGSRKSICAVFCHRCSSEPLLRWSWIVALTFLPWYLAGPARASALGPRMAQRDGISGEPTDQEAFVNEEAHKDSSHRRQR